MDLYTLDGLRAPLRRVRFWHAYDAWRGDVAGRGASSGRSTEFDGYCPGF